MSKQSVQYPADQVLIVWVSCPAGVAEKLAKMVVDKKLAACVHVMPQGTSFYFWAGAVQSDTEQLLKIKTAGAVIDRLQQFLLEQHPYDVPEFLSQPVSGYQPYLQWVVESLQNQQPDTEIKDPCRSC